MKENKNNDAAMQSNAKKRLKFKAHPNETAAKKDTKMKKSKVLNSILVVFLSIVCIGGVCVFFMIADIMKDAPNLTASSLISQDSSPILASNGDTLLEVGAENRQSITYDQVPQTVIDAFLAIEDSRYFTHNGFDLPRFVKSAINNLRNGDLGQGGSTLTMQMVDNVRKDEPDYDEFNASSWQKIEWKIQEIFLSMQVESDASKEDILTKYLNKVNFGSTARGIQKGSEYYFGKDVSQLNLSESAFLAGVVNAPNLFNPYKGTQWSENSQEWINFYNYAIERRDTTLYQMFNHGYISEEEYKLAKSTELAFQLNGERFFKSDSNDTILNIVREEAMDKYGVDIYSDSVIVHTSIDVETQQIADEIIRNDGVTTENGSLIAFPNKDNYDVGSTVINTKTGEIIAMVGGRNFNLDDATSKNQVTERHQTGSTIKPILDYAPGFDQLGYATSHTFADIPIDIYGNGNAVANSTGNYKGDVDFVEAVGQSYNTTAGQSLKDVLNVWGEDNVKNYMRQLGFDQDVVDGFVLQYSIGGEDMTSSTKTLAGAYASLANDGQYIEPHVITKIEFQNSDKEPIIPDYKKTQAMSAQAAYLMSDILQKATSNNFFMKQIWPQAGYTVYGKTGTSDWGDSGLSQGIPKGAIRDEWMVNYTGNFVVASWEGHNGFDYVDDALLNKNIPGHINRALLDKVAETNEMGVVENPGGISTISHVKGKYPYAAPTSSTPSDMIVTGMIRSDKAKLETLAADDLSSLSSFTATVQNDGKSIYLDFAPYPDQAKTQGASHSKAYNILGISFTGNVFYDPTFVFGRVVYRADIKVDGQVVQTITTSDPAATHTLNSAALGQKIQVCGYYGYEYDTKTSDVLCVNVTAPEGTKVNSSTLRALIIKATPYADPTRYQAIYVNALNTALSAANTTLNKTNATQDEINQRVSDLQDALDDCIEHPISSND